MAFCGVNGRRDDQVEPFTCRCWFVAVSDGGGRMVRACQENAIDCPARGIDWNGLMSGNGFLKCLEIRSRIHTRSVKNIKRALNQRARQGNYEFTVQYSGCLTVSVRVIGRGDAVIKVGDVEQCGSLISLHHHLQFALWPLDQLLGIYQW